MTYVDELADAIRREVNPKALPTGNTTSLFRLYALLALVKGPEITTEDVHNAWAVWMSDQDPTHESIRPYHQLTPHVQREDQAFADAIRKVASS